MRPAVESFNIFLAVLSAQWLGLEIMNKLPSDPVTFLLPILKTPARQTQWVKEQAVNERRSGICSIHESASFDALRSSIQRPLG